MIDLILGPLMPYIIGGLGLLAAWFGVSSKIKSSTIKKQDDAIKTHEDNEVELIRIIETQKQEVKTAGKVNEIHNEPSNLDASVERLRKRASKGGDGNKE